MKNSKIKKADFLDILQKKTAVSAIGPSALRNQGVGVLKVAQEYCGNIDLYAIVRKNRNIFNKILDKHTKRLLDKFPVKTKPWGTARKAINLFLRDALYNKYLSEEYKLKSIEEYLEIPLDSATARGLKKIGSKRELPPWPGLILLTKHQSDLFQEFAQKIADRKKLIRVHLDMYLWLDNR